MRKLLMIAAAAAVCSIAGSAVWSTPAWAAPGGQGPTRPYTEAKKFCPSGTNVAYVTQNVVNQKDVGLFWNTWATDSYQRIIAITRVGPDLYCAATRVSGKFSGVYGLSPAGTGTVSPDDTGSVYGGERTTVFTAKWHPTVPTSGSIGTVYCDPTFGCPREIDWASLFFQDMVGYDIAWWTFSYYGGTHGNWLNQADRSQGDITD
jgi:hypothetical protein